MLLAAFVQWPEHILNRDAVLDLARGLKAASSQQPINVTVRLLRRRLAEGRPARLMKAVLGVGNRFVLVARPAQVDVPVT